MKRKRRERADNQLRDLRNRFKNKNKRGINWERGMRKQKS
jgi:hypothetical protein